MNTAVSWVDRIEYLREAGDVKRCHVIRTVRHHNNASHTYGAMCIAFELAMLNSVDEIDLLSTLLALLYHDAPERDTGDMPADTKRALSPPARHELQRMENDAIIRNNLPDPRLTATTAAVVRAADSLDLGFAMLEERRAGNREPRVKKTFDNILTYTLDQTHLKGVPELRSYLAAEWSTVE